MNKIVTKVQPTLIQQWMNTEKKQRKKKCCQCTPNQKTCKLPRKYPAILAISKPGAETGFVNCIIGKVGSGKTYSTIELLTDIRGWRGDYDVIYIFSSTYLIQPIWKKVSGNLKVFLKYDSQAIETLMEEQKDIIENGGERSVAILFDDLGTSVLKNKDENAQENLEKLVISCRHLRISVLWLGQHFSQVPTYVREQCKSFISFGSMSHRELKKFHSECGVVSMKEFELLYNSAVQKPYGKFICTSVKGQTSYYSNYEQKIL